MRKIFKTDYILPLDWGWTLRVTTTLDQNEPGSVIYWPSTELSMKRCTCVTKRKNSGSRWTLGNDISWCPGGLSSVETVMPKWEPACRLRALGPQWPTVEQPQPRWRSAAMVKRRTWVNIAVCPCLQLISHTQQNIILSKKRCERFIFLYSFVIEVVHHWLIMFPCIFVYVHV